MKDFKANLTVHYIDKKSVATNLTCPFRMEVSFKFCFNSCNSVLLALTDLHSFASTVVTPSFNGLRVHKYNNDKTRSFNP